MSTIPTLFLQAGPGPGAIQLVFLVGMIVVMYFFMIRPQAKRAKEQKKFADNLGTGEKIITTAGIHATISRTNEDGTVVVEVSRGTFLTIERSAISMELTSAYQKRTQAPAATATAAK